MALSNQSVVIDILGNIAGFVSDMTRAQKEIEKRSKDIEAQARQMGQRIGAALGTAITGLATGTLLAINNMDKLVDSAKKVGVSASTFSELKFAVEQSGATVEALSAGFKGLAKQMADNPEKFAQIGVAVRDANGNMRDQVQVMQEIATKFKGYKDGAGEAALAQQLFGRSGVELIPFLNEGADGIERLRKEARELGVAFTDEAGEAAQQFGDNMDKLKGLAQGFFQSVANDVLPSLVALGNVFIEDGKAAIAANNDVSVFASTLQWLLKIAVSVNAAFQVVGRTIGGVFADITNNAEALTKIVSGNLMQKLEGIAAIKPALGVGEDISQVLETAARRIQAIEQPTVQAAKSVSAALGTIAPPIIESAEASAKAQKEMDRLAREQRKLAEEAARLHDAFVEGLESLEAELSGPLAVAQLEYNRKIAEMQKLLDEGTISIEEATRMQAAMGEQLERTVAELDPFNRLLEEATSGLIDGAAEQAMRLAMALEEVADPAMRRQMEDLLVRIDAVANGLEDAADSGEIFRDGMLEATNIVRDGFNDFIATGMSDWDGFMRAMQRSAQQSLGSIANMFQQTVLTQGGGGFRQFGANLNQQSMYGRGGTGSTVGGWMNAAGSAMSMVNAAESGNFWGSVGHGAAGGAQIGGWVGAIVGAVVGALAYVFMKPAPPGVNVIGSNVIGTHGYRNFAPGSQFHSALGGGALASVDSVPADVRAGLIQGIQQFDEAIAGFLSPEQLRDVKDRIANANQRFREGAITVEDVLEGRLATVMEAFPPIVATYVTSLESVEEQIAAFGAAVAILDDFESANTLGLETFEETMQVLADLTVEGQNIGQTFDRLAAGVTMLDAVMEAFGIAFDGTRREFIEFTDDLIERVGGIDRANQLFTNAMNAVFSPAEQAQMRVDRARAHATQQFADIGLGPDATIEQIRAVWAEAIRTGDDALLAEAMEAAEAFGMLSNALSNLATVTGTASDGVILLGQALDPSHNFQPGGRPGTNWRTFGDDFGGDNPVEAVEEFAAATISAGQAALDAAAAQTELIASYERLQDQINDAIRGIQEWLDAQRFSDTSTLNPLEQLQEAQRQFDVQLLAAQAGDVDALRSITGIADTLLGEGREFFGSGDDYTRMEAFVRGALEAIVASPPQIRPEEETADNTAEIVRQIGITNERLLEIERATEEGTEENVRMRLALERINAFGARA